MGGASCSHHGFDRPWGYTDSTMRCAVQFYFLVHGVCAVLLFFLRVCAWQERKSFSVHGVRDMLCFLMICPVYYFSLHAIAWCVLCYYFLGSCSLVRQGRRYWCMQCLEFPTILFPWFTSLVVCAVRTFSGALFPCFTCGVCGVSFMGCCFIGGTVFVIYNYIILYF